ncbi:hypothetical protein APY03_2717 [Variovorax sp. WDL1]|nr:hypothetical protein APY03_2717 [Variovorax sp. WDL1]
MLKATAFVLATVAATGMLVAAGLAEEPQPAATSACLFCLPAAAR